MENEIFVSKIAYKREKGRSCQKEPAPFRVLTARRSQQRGRVGHTERDQTNNQKGGNNTRLVRERLVPDFHSGIVGIPDEVNVLNAEVHGKVEQVSRNKGPDGGDHDSPRGSDVGTVGFLGNVGRGVDADIVPGSGQHGNQVNHADGTIFAPTRSVVKLAKHGRGRVQVSRVGGKRPDDEEEPGDDHEIRDPGRHDGKHGFAKDVEDDADKHKDDVESVLFKKKLGNRRKEG